MKQFPTIQELMTMPLIRLRGLDIRNAQEEAMVQVAVNARVLSEPVTKPLNLRVPDIKNGEEEAYWQAKVDEHRNSQRPEQISMADIVPDGNVDIPLMEDSGEEPVQLPEEVKIELKRFCEFCDSKGVRHKKVCTRPK